MTFQSEADKLRMISNREARAAKRAAAAEKRRQEVERKRKEREEQIKVIWVVLIRTSELYYLCVNLFMG